MIYATPFDPVTLRCTSPSQPAGFESIAQVLAVMGEGWTTCSSRLVIYDAVAFSDYAFLLTPSSATDNVAATVPQPEAD